MDAYISDGNTDPIATPSNYRRDAVDDLQSLTSSIKNIRLDSTSPQRNTNQKSSLRVIKGGYKVPHSTLLELKTRAQHRPIQTFDVIIQLWFAQVRHLITGYHFRGKFVRLEQKEFVQSKEFENFERGKGSVLRRFVQVVERIRATMKGKKIDKSVLFENDSLKLYERTGTWDILPLDLLSKWD